MYVYIFRATPVTNGRSLARRPVGLVLHLLGYTTATAAGCPSNVCNLNQSSQQRWILNPLSQGTYQTHILMDTSQAHHCGATMGTALKYF